MRSHRRTPTGIRPRHSRSCATSHGQERCNCSPSYEAFVYSAADGKKIRRVFPTLAAARSWRHDSATAVRRGAMRAPTATTLREAWEAWVEVPGEGRDPQPQPQALQALCSTRIRQRPLLYADTTTR